MSKIIELFGYSTELKNANWSDISSKQYCPFLKKKCYKVRKSEPEVSIGSCTVLYKGNPLIICPARLVQDNQVFRDCLGLLDNRGDLRIISEVGIPGGKVDYFLVSVQNDVVVDFAGIEVQAIDTTGSVWPERQKFLRKKGVINTEDREFTGNFGINWKMTTKTTLFQIHHKLLTFEHINKRLVLVIQDKLFDYMSEQFNFDHFHTPPEDNDSFRIHTYRMEIGTQQEFRLALQSRLGTDAIGVAQCLGLRADARIELSTITQALTARLPAALRLDDC